MKPGTGSLKRESPQQFKDRLTKEMRDEAARLEAQAQQLKAAAAVMEGKK